MSNSTTTLDLIVGLRDPAARIEVARSLAGRLGVEEVLLFVRDPELPILLPAPGFPQTIRGGRAWRAFLGECVRTARCTGEVDLPEGARRPAVGCMHGELAVVLLGGRPRKRELEALERLLPMLAALLSAEQQISLARAQASDAQEGARRAHTLTQALEVARAETSRLNAELRVQDRQKDQFLAMLGHELRNPLAALASAVELMKRDTVDEHTLRRLLEIMTRQMGQLTRLVNDLLDVSRVSRGLIDLQREVIVLSEVLQDALNENRPLLAERQHTTTLRASEALEVQGDRVRLTQIFGNLINNAAKYTDPGGTVAVSVRRDGGSALVEIRDSGIGIAPDMLPKIFDLFAQAPAMLGQTRGGLGIGLTLVRTLVAMHDGEISAASDGVGRGTTFQVRLPLASQQASRSAQPAAPADTVPRALEVLVVDDNKDAADSTAELLRMLGQRVDIAYGGPQALELAASRRYQLVLLDIGMPGMDGYEVAKALRSAQHGAARIVALTGFGTAPLSRAREKLFDEHAAKPVSLEGFKALLARAAEHSNGRSGGAARESA